MQATHTLKVERRERLGSRYSKRARAAGKLPCVVYGQDREPAHLLLDAKEALKCFHDGERVFTISTGDADQTVLLKDLQFDYLGDNVIHCDLLRVNLSQEIEANVTLTLHGDPKGQHEEGAVLVQKAQDVPVLCAVSALPEELILEIGELGVNESLSLGDVPLPEGVKLNADPETVAVVISVVAEEPVEEEAAEVGAEEGPEVIGEGDGEGAEEGGDEESSGGDGSEGEGKEG